MKVVPDLLMLSVQEVGLLVGRHSQGIAKGAGSTLCEGHVGHAEVAKEVGGVTASISGVAAAVVVVAVKGALVRCMSGP